MKPADPYSISADPGQHPPFFPRAAAPLLIFQNSASLLHVFRLLVARTFRGLGRRVGEKR